MHGTTIKNTVLLFIMNVETCKMSSLDFYVLLMYSDFVIVFVSWDNEVVSVRDFVYNYKCGCTLLYEGVCAGNRAL